MNYGQFLKFMMILNRTDTYSLEA